MEDPRYGETIDLSFSIYAARCKCFHDKKNYLLTKHSFLITVLSSLFLQETTGTRLNEHSTPLQPQSPPTRNGPYSCLGSSTQWLYPLQLQHSKLRPSPLGSHPPPPIRLDSRLMHHLPSLPPPPTRAPCAHLVLRRTHRPCA